MIDVVEKQILIKPENSLGVSPDIAFILLSYSMPARLTHLIACDKLFS